MKRTNKFYRKNEKDLMNYLGFKETKNSGAGWIEKEDGYNDKFLVQLKSTDSNSIRINKKDLDTLNYHAHISRKNSLFMIQFLQSDEIYAVIDVKDLINLGIINKMKDIAVEGPILHCDGQKEISNKKPKKMIKSSYNAKYDFLEDNDNKFKKKEKKAY